MYLLSAFSVLCTGNIFGGLVTGMFGLFCIVQTTIWLSNNRLISPALSNPTLERIGEQPVDRRRRWLIPRFFMASMNPSAIPAFLVALVASALVWGLSPLVTGHLEPWDADGLYYVGALTVTGMGTGGFFPRPLWAHYLGSVVGQITYELIFLKLGPLFLVGMVFLLGYSVVFLVAAAIAARVRVYFTRSTF
jgi:hypothetical protein